MYLRAKKRIKDGKEHRYWSIVESCRNLDGRVVQRQVLYLGEIGRVAAGSYPPAAPTDPGVPHSGTRLLR